MKSDTKKTWKGSVWALRCPRCRTGRLFTSAYGMHDRCTYCNQKYMPEPGFYYGAMFVSYILSGWVLVLPALFMVFYLKWTITTSLVITGIAAALTHNFFFRISRSLWIHMMVRHRPDIVAKLKAQHSAPMT